MRIDVTYLRFDQSASWEELSDYLGCISHQRWQRLEHFIFETDKMASLLAELLIRHEVMRTLGAANAEIVFARDSRGKPFLDRFPDYHFSVSHTDGCVAFAGGSAPVGIDAEKIAAHHPGIADRFFTPREARWIEQQENKMLAFCQIWTRKEAYLKLLGTGLSRPLRSFDVLDEEQNYSFTTQNLPEHLITICSAAGEIADFQEITIEQLLAVFDGLPK